MSHAVWMHRADSIYDDSPPERYQFPRQYLGRVKPSIGHWIVYLEPTKVPGSRGYFAIAQVAGVVPDPTEQGMFIAHIEPGTYLPFAQPVAFNVDGQPVERGLLNEQGRLSGRAQAAVRPLSSEDFNRILDIGFRDAGATLPRSDDAPALTGFADTQTPFDIAGPRARIARITTRAVRDRVFRTLVLRAYDERCALTGLKFINGGGRAEVNAAHIQPVAAGGPDTVNNGIALSGTAHWMFDRGLISLDDDLRILISRHVNDQESAAAFINRTGIAVRPVDRRDRPHPRFLHWHRTNCFKT